MKKHLRLLVVCIAVVSAAQCWAGSYSLNSSANSVGFQSVGVSGYTSQSYSCYPVSGTGHTFETDWQVIISKESRMNITVGPGSGTWYTTYTWGLKYTPSGSGDVPDSTVPIYYEGRDNIQDTADLETFDSNPYGSSVYDGVCDIIPHTVLSGISYELSLSGQCWLSGSNGTGGTWGSPTTYGGANSTAWTLGGDGNYYGTFTTTIESQDGMGGSISYVSGDHCKSLISLGDQLAEQWTVTQVGSQTFTPWA